MAKSEDEAYELILGDGARCSTFRTEKNDLRDRYGRNTFGQSCLMARRLVERGVPYVTINYNGWDTHKQHFQAMRRKLPEMDKGMATLLQDLSDHKPARQHDHLVERRVRQNSEGPMGRTLERRAGTLGQRLLGGLGRRRIQGRPRRRIVRRQGRTGERAARLSVRSIGSMYEMLGIDPTRNCRIPRD